jgi:hypothetical protein
MRVFNRLLAVLVSAAVIAAAAMVVTEVAAHRLGVRPVVFNWHATYRWAQRTAWNAAAVRAGCLLIAVVGLAVLAVQLKPRRPARLSIRDGDPATDAAITRRGLVHTLAATVDDVEGVIARRVALHRSRVKIRVEARAGQPETAVRDAVRRAAQDRLDALHLRHPPRLAVRVSSREG